MRVWYEIYDDLSCTFVKRFGDYVHDEWMDAMRRINDDPRLRPGMSRIVDLREGGGSATNEQIADLAQFFGKYDKALGRRKVAIIAPKLVDYGMNRMYEVIPTVIDQNPCAHLRMPRDMIFHGWSMRLFQAWQHSATMSS